MKLISVLKYRKNAKKYKRIRKYKTKFNILKIIVSK